MVRNMKISLPNDKSSKNVLEVFNKPDKVYIPLIVSGDRDITILVNKGDYVYKGEIIAKSKGNYRLPIHSSVSGTVIDFVEKTCFDGSKIKCVAIENDFKEKIEQKLSVKRHINKYTKEEFIERLKENGIVGLGGAGFPTYVKYESNKIKTLIINAVECEPFITADYVIIKNKIEEILEVIDAILEINKIDEAIIAIKKDNIELKQLFDNFIGTYLKIKVKIVPNYYPVGWERELIKKVTNKTYEKLPSECGVVVNNISTIYSIYEALKYNKPLIERIVTIYNKDTFEGKNILLKIGTPTSCFLNNDHKVIAGGPMMGKEVDNDLVISNNINCILLTKRDSIKPIECLNCGKCVNVCPTKLSPVLIMKSINSKEKDINKIKKLMPEKCCECGLCSYICPSKILVRQEVIKAKQQLKEAK